MQKLMSNPDHNLTRDELPLVSIVTPTFNQSHFLRDTIESVLEQNYEGVEYLVLDDGSTDNTPQILADYNGRVEWESQPNMGQTPTINKGWQRSRGEIVTWLNSDDTLLPGALEKVVAYFNEHSEVDIVFGDTIFTKEDGTPIERSKRRSAFDYKTFVVECDNPIAQPSAFIRRRVVDEAGLLDPHYYYFMDWDFWLRAGLNHKIAYLPEPLSTYRLHSESKTIAQAARAAPELEYMYRKFFQHDDVPAEIRRFERRAMVNMFFTSGGYYLRGNDRKNAARMALRAFRIYPQGMVEPEMVHKLAYCLLGGSSLYERGRKMYQRA
jgi:glycosyltransferase involved in cell wall biosynthesis